MAKLRYMFGQKQSDAEIERILTLYAADVSASDAVRAAAKSKRPSGSANTIFGLYDLVRRRLIEIGYYPDPESYMDYWQSRPELRLSFDLSATKRRMEERFQDAKGISSRTARYHLAEAIFRAENPSLTAKALLNDIRMIIGITGPLNRPPINIDIVKQRIYIRTLEQRLNEIRRKPAVRREKLNSTDPKVRRFAHSQLDSRRRLLAIQKQLIDLAERRLKLMLSKDGKSKPARKMPARSKGNL